MLNSAHMRGDLDPVDHLYARVFATPDGPAVLDRLPLDMRRTIEAAIVRCRRQWATGTHA